MSSDAVRAAETIERLVQTNEAPTGSLRVFGDWFGRAHDNWHRPVSTSAEGDVLSVTFDGGETLDVWEPVGVSISPTQFRIEHAARVRWQWFYYGRPKTDENLFSQEHRVQDGVVHASTTATWYAPLFNPSTDHPAVELL